MARAAAAALLLAGAWGVAAARAQGAVPSPTYEYIRGNGVLDLYFHGVPLKAVHDDGRQNEIAIDFQQPINSSVFDRLQADLPDWISVSFANYDSAVIRAARPVSFAAHSEGDGFSLRLTLLGPAPPPPPVVYSDSPNARFAPPSYDEDATLRGAYGPDDLRAAHAYYAGSLAHHPDDAGLQLAYARSGAGGGSGWGVGGAWRQSHGQTIIDGTARAKIGVGAGLSLIGSFDTTSAEDSSTRQPDGSFAATRRSVLAGSAGIALDIGPDSLVSAEALYGDHILGGRVIAFADAPDGYWYDQLIYHEPYTQSAEALAARAVKDEASIAAARDLGDGLWGGIGLDASRYGVHGNANAVHTLGWNANLRYTADFSGLLAGIAYDGLGEYITRAAKFTGAAPSPYTPLSIRTREIHMGTASISYPLPGDFGIDLYGGYALDRYANNGLLAGVAIHFRPVPGFDLALGARYSKVALIQGETGAETLAGVTLNIGVDGGPGLLR